MADIQLYVATRSARLPIADEREREKLVENVVTKAAGSFLWTTLVMKQLEDIVTFEEINDVLDEIPQEISDLYQRSIKKMERSRTKLLAKHMITWAICATHPLTVDQMKDAMKLSLGATVARDLRASLPHLCGQFLIVDGQSHIKVVHETARAFLTDPDLTSDFRVNFEDGHDMLAQACLKYLLSDELKYRGGRRRATPKASERLPIANYACIHFGEHVSPASSSSSELLRMLDEFFKTNVLSWIECVARLRDLDCIVQASGNLSTYLRRREKPSPMAPLVLFAWVTDLRRVVTLYGTGLLDDPAMIHTLVPPFCPQDSAIFRNFSHPEGGIRLVGSAKCGWDDKILSISYDRRKATAVACRDERFAVGMADGEAIIHKTSTFENFTSLMHGESISVLEFGVTSRLLASCGPGI